MSTKYEECRVMLPDIINFYKDGTADVFRTSQITGKCHSATLKLTQEQYRAWVSGINIQTAMSHLDNGEREFIMTGVTPVEWDEAFSINEEDEGE